MGCAVARRWRAMRARTRARLGETPSVALAAAGRERGSGGGD
jgi:hypothetical protein